jgi:UDP-N-acetylmuramate--alanine ligase
MFFKSQPVHFIGIGGIGMSSLAEVLLDMGYPVTGSDLKVSPTTERLTTRGALVYEGHTPANLAGAKMVVYSSAVRPDNPEIAEARRRKLPVIPRGELLAELMRQKFGIAIAGSHGKTTTTAMVAAILIHANLDPTILVGGRMGINGSNARLGKSDYLVVESDESDGSFLKLAPILAVVTNIDREHLDHYPSIVEIRQAFVDFVNKVPFYGAAIVCLDDENVQQIYPAINRRTISYGKSPQADLAIVDAACGHFESRFQIRLRGRDLGEFQLRIPGFHNVLNASAAIAVALELEVSPQHARTALAAFTGVDRRFQVRGQERCVTVIDDYGHHPTEIRATLAAARLCDYKRIHVIFQPHRYTRTQALLDDFAMSFHQADSAYLLDIYAASEPPIEGVTSALLADRLREFGHRDAQYVGTIDRAIEAVSRAVQPGDLVLTLGAGNVWQAGDKLLGRLREAA